VPHFPHRVPHFSRAFCARSRDVAGSLPLVHYPVIQRRYAIMRSMIVRRTILRSRGACLRRTICHPDEAESSAFAEDSQGRTSALGEPPRLPGIPTAGHWAPHFLRFLREKRGLGANDFHRPIVTSDLAPESRLVHDCPGTGSRRSKHRQRRNGKKPVRN